MVYFFPAAHTSGCNVEAHLFSESIDKFKAENVTVIGVTAGNTDQLADFSKETEHCGGKFPVAADADAKIAGEYDALLKMKPGLVGSHVVSDRAVGHDRGGLFGAQAGRSRQGNARRGEVAQEMINGGGALTCRRFFSPPRFFSDAAICSSAGSRHAPARADRAIARA